MEKKMNRIKQGVLRIYNKNNKYDADFLKIIKINV